MRSWLIFAGLGVALVAGFVACGGPRPAEIASNKPVERSGTGPVVVFLPGTLASTLVDLETGERVWGRTDALSLDPREPEGLRRLSLPLRPAPAGKGAAPDTVVAVDVLRRANERVLGIPISISIYDDLLEGLSAAGLDERAPFDVPKTGPTVTPFPYDWRRSVVDAAQTLGEALEARGPDAEKVRLVGHSMGGVVALWYLMYGTAPFEPGSPPPLTWAGAEHVEQAILVGAPLRGSVIAVRNTINGNDIASPLVPIYPPAMLASHPSSFELMPRSEASILVGANGATLATHLDGAFWQRMQWGLADPTQAPAIRMISAQTPDLPAQTLIRQADLMARAEAFHRAADQPITPPAGLDIFVIAGTGTATPARLSIPESQRPVSVVAKVDGDGTVSLDSAMAGNARLADQTGVSVSTYPVEHMRMMSDPAVFSDIIEILSR